MRGLVVRLGAVLCAVLFLTTTASAVAPVVSNVRASQRVGTEWVDIYYDLADSDSGSLAVSVAVSTNDGATFALPATSFSDGGATPSYGSGVSPGADRWIVWNAGADWNGEYSSIVKFQVTADDGSAPPADMVLIPAGSFVMGATTNIGHESNLNELPQHTVNLGAFYMDVYEVTKARWDEVRTYNGGNGYSYSDTGLGKATNHPVQTVNWYDAVKWCNARSQRDGLIPVYYTDAAFTTVYKTGEIDPVANWYANGYRLPTEAEWERAARGGVADTRFPWTDYTNNIAWEKANYVGYSSGYSYDLSGGDGDYHPTFATGAQPYTSPAGYFAPNGYGLYDMAGNVSEWCWDWYDASYYSTAPDTDPRGPATGASRVLRGGRWNADAYAARVAYRDDSRAASGNFVFGFRCARRTTVPMALIPAGSFVMGYATNAFPASDGTSDELPQHTVNVGLFHLDVYEVTKALWDEVKAHNGGNGYSYSNTGFGKAPNHPVQTVNWYDAVKWCNARSQWDGLTPVYYTDAGFATVYKTGELAPFANWSANGYRLPTEAEWEKAAQGGAANRRFSWSDSDTIQHARANYYASSSYSYDISPTTGYHPTFATDTQPYTSPAGYFAPNGYGLYDMAGDVWEWCWDWYDSTYYASSSTIDPRGPANPLASRVVRGASWYSNPPDVRGANRDSAGPDSESDALGFRCARGTNAGPMQEVAVLGTNLAMIASGDNTPSTDDGTDFGSADVVAGTVTRTFFITNSASTVLTISGVTTSGVHAADFSVLSFPASVSPGGRSNLTVRFDPSDTGLRMATLTVHNDDSAEGNYSFAVEGTDPDYTPPGMALIPAGSFVMGNATNVFPASEGASHELPQHTVNVSAFYMDRYEVTKALWDEVKAHNGGNGYLYSYTGLGKATNHPVHTVNWYDAVKWCNARSQRDGLLPVYYTDAGFATVYKTGEIDPIAHWAADGYRLPTEAEWERAARGGASDTRFPWTDYTNKIAWAKANYYGKSAWFGYDLSGMDGDYHSMFATGGSPYTSPVGYFAPNGYGLYDMAGNVWEWCWDWYSSSYYGSSPGTDPRGGAPGSSRVRRGGSWEEFGYYARIACRYDSPPDVSYDRIGFRCARGL